ERSSELWRFGSMTNGSGQTNVCKLDSRTHAPEHEPAAAHVAAPHKFGRKQQALAKNLKERLDVLRSRYAAKKYNLAICSDPIGELVRIPVKRPAIFVICDINLTCADLVQLR